MENTGDDSQERGILGSIRVAIWWRLLALAGFAWAVAGFVYFSREYSTAPSVRPDCYCFTGEVWADIVFPSTLHLGLGLIVMVVGLVMAAWAGRASQPGGHRHMG